MRNPDVVLDYTKWAGQEGGIGKYIISRSPSGGLAAGVEQVIKLRELSQDTAGLVRNLCSHLGALRVNIICHADGEPDRIEVYRLRG